MKNWPANPSDVKSPSIPMPSFKKYYPSTDCMDTEQLAFYRYWRNEWQAKRPRYADLSYIFTYIYEIINLGVQRKNDENILLEINALIGCYPGKIADYLMVWKIDLLLFHELYEEAFICLAENNIKRKNNINRILNLKVLLGKPMEGKDLLNFAEMLGLKLYKATQRHLDEAYSSCQEILFDFCQEEGEELLFHITNHFNYEKRHTVYVFSGVPFHKTETIKNDMLAIEVEYSESKTLKEKWFNFWEISFFAEFALRNVDKINKEIKYGYQDTKEKRASQTRLAKYSQTIWEIKAHEPFKNPAINLNNDTCNHEYIRLLNHWETYRKYECIKCKKMFSCSCERKILERIRPKKKEATWTKGICPKCRDLDDTSPVTSDKLMYGSTFYAQHWREMNFERDRMIFDIAEKEGKVPLEVSSALLRSHEPENLVRQRYGLPLVGEGWISETCLYKILKELFPKNQVTHHGTAEWLGNMHLDIYMPELKIAFEYQGRQHKVPIEYFGGKEGFETIKARDKKKLQLCQANEVKLFYIYEGQDFSEEVLRNMLKDYL